MKKQSLEFLFFFALITAVISLCLFLFCNHPWINVIALALGLLSASAVCEGIEALDKE